MTVAVCVSNRKINFVIHELKNISTEMSLADEKTAIEILQCEISSISFLLKKHSGIKGQLISIKGALQINNEAETQFAAIGRISEIKSISDGEQQVTVKMNQYDPETWRRIIERIGKKQKRIDKLFQAMRGED